MNYKKLGLIIIIVAALVVGGYAYKKSAGNKMITSQTSTQAAANSNTSDQGQVAGAETQTANSVAYNGQDGKNALELLKNVAQVEYQDSANGAFIQAINGVKNAASTYWIFYVNGQMAQVAADKLVTKSSDKIEWKFETYQ